MGINIFNLFRCLATITLITDTSQKRERWPKRDFTKRLQDSSTQATFSIPSFWVLYPRSSISQLTSLSLTGCKSPKDKRMTKQILPRLAKEGELTASGLAYAVIMAPSMDIAITGLTKILENNQESAALIHLLTTAGYTTKTETHQSV